MKCQMFSFSLINYDLSPSSKSIDAKLVYFDDRILCLCELMDNLCAFEVEQIEKNKISNV